MDVQVWVPRKSNDASEGAALQADSLQGDALWDELKTEALGCRSCALYTHRQKVVFGVGSPASDWLIVGEAPGAEEDRRGEPFVGPAGQLLDAMLHAIGLNREKVYIANVLKCRPPGNRDPQSEEVATCSAYLDRQIDIIQPRMILAVGRFAAQYLLASERSIGALRGRVWTYSRTGASLVVTYHPSYLLRKPVEKVKAWHDLSLARDAYQEQVAKVNAAS